MNTPWSASHYDVPNLGNRQGVSTSIPRSPGNAVLGAKETAWEGIPSERPRGTVVEAGTVELTVSEDLAEGQSKKLDASLELLCENDPELHLRSDEIDGLATHIIDTSGSSGRALADFQMQSMLLEQQNKRRLLRARQMKRLTNAGRSSIRSDSLNMQTGSHSSLPGNSSPEVREEAAVNRVNESAVPAMKRSRLDHLSNDSINNSNRASRVSVHRFPEDKALESEVRVMNLELGERVRCMSVDLI
ncbi:MAG: hypothetical protein Q9162_005274 [Coniocarpon cinnabarinum]